MSQPQGPAMICATKVVNPGRARIGELGGGVTLPRTVEIVTLVAVGIGLLVGAAFGALIPADGFSKIAYSAVAGGAAGWFLTTFSPMQGESMIAWLGLTVRTLRRQRYVNGEAVVLAVGCAPIDHHPQGELVIARGAVRVRAGSYDERGVQRTASNRNLPDGAFAVAGAFALSAAPMPGSTASTVGAAIAPPPSAQAASSVAGRATREPAMPAPSSPSALSTRRERSRREKRRESSPARPRSLKD